MQSKTKSDQVRILVVEDEAAISIMLEQTVKDLGYAVAGAAHSVAEALSLAASDPPDCALLDVRLGEEFVYEAADVLRSRGVPVVFVTGYSPGGIHRRFASVPLVEKPFAEHDLRDAIKAALTGVRTDSAPPPARRIAPHRLGIDP